MNLLYNLAKHFKSTTAQLILSKYCKVSVRCNLASNNDISEEVQIILAEDNPFVRMNLSKNPNISEKNTINIYQY